MTYMVKDTDGFVYGATLFGEKLLILEEARKKKSRKQERGDYLRYFMARLNPSRKLAGYKELTEARMGYILKGIETKDLYAFQRMCEKAKNFSTKFWWELDPKKHGKLQA